jgi:D-glycero-alpha-D-manno-heptose-7-phosphate kinase
MIVTKTPFRITLGGGGTDLPSYANTYGGYVFAVTINKYMYIVLNEPFDDLIRLKYSKSETVDNIDKLDHAIAREVLRYTGIDKKIDVVSLADIPAGTGLGSSSCYTVGLLNAIYAYRRVTTKNVAQSAHYIEADVLKYPVGYQDQYMAALGGFQELRNSMKYNEIINTKIHFPQSITAELNRNLLMFYTYTKHDSNVILTEENKQVSQNNGALENLHEIKHIGMKIRDAVWSGDLDMVGVLMDQHWNCKKKITSQMTTSRFDEIYDLAKRHGALGGKITGSGGAGFFIFYVNKDHHAFITKMEAQGMKHMTYSFESLGSRVIIDI